MKKYTVYEIEKLTKGKLTKYKLNQAILKGELVAEEVKGEKKGKGIPKFFIYEEKLQEYLKKIETERKRRIILPGEDQPTLTEEIKTIYSKIIEQKDEIIQAQNTQIEKLMERVKLLEQQTEKLFPLLNSEEKRRISDQGRKEERKELLMELANISVTNKKDKFAKLLKNI